MFISIALGAALIAIGAWRLRAWLRRGDAAEPRWLSAATITAETGAWVAAAGMLFCLAVPAGTSAFLWCFLAAVTLGLLARAAGRLRAGVLLAGASTVRAFAHERAVESVRRAVRTVRRFCSIVAPTGWSELRLGFGTLERALEPMLMVRVYLLAFVFAPTLVILALIMSLNSGDLLQRGVVGVFVGYNALALVSYLTAATVITLVLAILLRAIRAITVRPDLKGVFVTIAQGIGFGTAAGLVAAALLPMMLRFFPLSSAATSVTPAILVDIPGACGVAGYILGVLAATPGVFRSAENLVIRNAIGPAIFVGAIWALSALDFGPNRILSGILASTSTLAVECNDAALESYVSDPARMVGAITACGGDVTFMSDDALLGTLTFLLVVFALGFFVRDVRRASAPAINTPAA